MRILPGLEGVPDWFKRTPAGKTAIKEAEETVATQRATLAKRLAAAIHRRNGDEAKRLGKAQEAAWEGILEARRQLKAAEQVHTAAYFALAGHTLGCDHEIAKLRAELRVTSDPAIYEFDQELERTLDRMRKGDGIEVVEDRTMRDAYLRPARYSNRASWERCFDAIVAMRHWIEELHYSGKADVGDEIAALRASLPQIEPARIPGSKAEPSAA